MKGTILDLVFIMVILGISVVGLIIASEVYSQLDDSGAFGTTDAAVAAQRGVESTFDVLNYGMVLILAGLLISTIIGAIMIRTHPIFFIVSIIMLIIVVVASAPVTNAIMGIATSGDLADDAAQYGIATQVVGNMPAIFVVAGFVIIIALYAKPRGEV